MDLKNRYVSVIILSRYVPAAYTPGIYMLHSFGLEAESTPGPIVWPLIIIPH